MSVFNRLYNAGKSKLAKILLVGAIATLPFLIGCKDKKDDIIPPPVNHDPSIVTTDLGNATEGQDINKTIEGEDVDGDYPLNFSIISGPAGASISPIDNTHALLSYNPPHEESDQTQNFTIGVQDSTGKTAQRVYTLPVTNVSDVIINVKKLGSGEPGTPIEGIDVSLGSDTQTTDSAGVCTFPNKPTGSYPVIIKDSVLADYITHKPRNINVSKAEEDAGNLNLEKRLLPESHFDFLEDTVRSSRSNGEINKFDSSATIIFDIYKIEVKDETSVPQANIDLVKNLIKDKLSNRYGHTFTAANIIEHNTLPIVGQPEDNHIKVYWDNNYGGGGNGTWTNGTRILSASTRVNTGLGEEFWLSEFGNALTNSSDSNLYSSYRNDPPTVSDPTYADDIVDETNKYRPEGNKDLKDGNLDNRDVDL